MSESETKNDIEFVDKRELPEVRYRNEYVKKWSEVATALRYRLRIEERDAYDAKASAASPEPLEPGDEVEVKACKQWVENGDEYGTSGRWHITDSSHETLLEHGGYYVLAVYDLVDDVAGGERVRILGMELVSAERVDEELFRGGSCDSHRLGYKWLFPDVHPSSDDPRERVKGDGQQPANEREENSGGDGPEPEPEFAGESESGEEEPPAVKVISNEQRHPSDLRDKEIWVVWAFDDAGRKRPRAPWQTGHCYPVSWGEDAAQRPETSFEEARKWSQFGAEIQQQWPFPEDSPDKSLKLGMFLPHDSPEPPIMQIDLDNVRHPETGELVPEAASILDEFPETYAIVSVSGKGIHLYVRAALDDRGKFVEPLGEYDAPAFEGLTEPPQLELYDHGRFCAITGQHIEGAGTEVPEAQERVDRLVEQWDTTECASCGRTYQTRELPEPGDDGPLECPDCGEEMGSDTREFDPERYRRQRDLDSSAGNRSPYFSEPIERFGEPKANGASTGEGFGGAHPAHGGTSSPDSESTNYAVNVSENAWYCFAHGSGGGPLSLVAVIEGELRCRNPNLSNLDDEEYLKVCLAARDDYGFSGDPPYRALVGVAREHNLPMADEEEGILGHDTYGVARRIYNNS